MTTKEKIDRLKKIQKQKYGKIHTKDDARDYAALESAIEALEILDKFHTSENILLVKEESET